MTTLTKMTALCGAAIIAACASMEGDSNQPRGIAAFADDPRLGEEISKVCFSSTIDGFTDATRDTVVLKKGVSDEYIVEVMGSCRDLKYAQRIGIDTHLSCLTRTDYLIVSDSAFGNSTGIGPDRCPINRIYKWDSKAEEEPAEAEATVATQ